MLKYSLRENTLKGKHLEEDNNLEGNFLYRKNSCERDNALKGSTDGTVKEYILKKKKSGWKGYSKEEDKLKIKTLWMERYFVA